MPVAPITFEAIRQALAPLVAQAGEERVYWITDLGGNEDGRALDSTDFCRGCAEKHVAEVNAARRLASKAEPDDFGDYDDDCVVSGGNEIQVRDGGPEYCGQDMRDDTGEPVGCGVLLEGSLSPEGRRTELQNFQEYPLVAPLGPDEASAFVDLVLATQEGSTKPEEQEAERAILLIWFNYLRTLHTHLRKKRKNRHALHAPDNVPGAAHS